MMKFSGGPDSIHTAIGFVEGLQKLMPPRSKAE